MAPFSFSSRSFGRDSILAYALNYASRIQMVAIKSLDVLIASIAAFHDGTAVQHNIPQFAPTHLQEARSTKSIDLALSARI
jgi:hypothetical protein